MSGIFGGSTSITEQRIGSIQIQTSSYGLPITILHGQTRITGNLIWSGDFVAIPHTESQGGKGGGVETTSYTYQVAMAMALCEGEISSVLSCWVDDAIYRPIAAHTDAKQKQREHHTVPVSGPYTVTADAGADWTADIGVFSGDIVLTSPDDYTVAEGLYTFDAVWAGADVYLTYAYDYTTPAATAIEQLGLTMFPGAATPTPWGYLTANHPDEAMAYPDTAYVAAGAYGLGRSASPGNHSFEVVGPHQIGGGIVDCDPAVSLLALLTHARAGAGFPADRVQISTAWSDWCVASGLWISPALTEQRRAGDIIQEIVRSCGGDIRYSEGVLQILPLGDDTVTGQGRTYTPDLSPAYHLTDDDFLADGGDDPVKVSRVADADAHNHYQIEFRNRANEYNIQTAEARDSADVVANGLRSAPVETMHWFCDPQAAQRAVEWRKQRSRYIRNRYEFRLGMRYSRLEPLDIVTLTDATLGLDQFPVRIREIEEDEGELAIIAEELAIGVNRIGPVYAPTVSGAGNVAAYAAPGPVADPIVFEPPLSLTDGRAEVWIAITGAGADWGGCTLWASLDDQTYQAIGTITEGARYGELTASLAAPSADPDETNTLSVEINTGNLYSASETEADAGLSLCLVGAELLAYATATLTGAQAYDLDYLRRGLYGTAAEAHDSGAEFVRLDGQVFRYPINASLIGQTVYLKATSFNLRGQRQEALDSVSTYAHRIAGAKASAPTGLALDAAFTGTAVAVHWSAASGATAYVVEIWSAGTLRRSTTVSATAYSYTLEMATSDGGPWRDLDIKVASQANGQTSSYASLSVSNPTPVAPTGITTSAGSTSITMTWAAVADTDLQDYQVWISTTDGFTPGAGTLAYTGDATTATLTGLLPSTTYYLRIAARDRWGTAALNYSAQHTQATA